MKMKTAQLNKYKIKSHDVTKGPLTISAKTEKAARIKAMKKFWGNPTTAVPAAAGAVYQGFGLMCEMEITSPKTEE